MTEKELLLDINNLIKEQKLYHSLIFSSTDENLLKGLGSEISRMIFCSNNSIENDGCEWCKKSDNKNILSNMVIGDGTTKIKKEVIQEVIHNFSQSNLETTKEKVYSIFNGENMTQDASNSLLKFLEEPPANVTALIFTNDRSELLTTIKSRCKIFVLENNDNTVVEDDFFKQAILSKNKPDILLATNKFKQMDKSEVVDILNQIYKELIITTYVDFAEEYLDILNDYKHGSNGNTPLEVLVIRLTEEI